MTERTIVDVDKYMEFVNKTTSYPSQSNAELCKRIIELDKKDIQIARLLTAAIGLSAEGGEFTEIVKKMAFQGKELTDESKLHMVKELGDVFWYFSQACMALDVDFNTVLTQNMAKLLARYPEGTFDIYRSENRREGDI
tara:strand:- start:4328 stop:4744 length:417 start_codon:yes stop_codon:yes gene_type:complete